MKTNAARLLDSMKIEYELRSYEVDPKDLSAETVALARSDCRWSKSSRRSSHAVIATASASPSFPAIVNWT